ncbi:MAG: hypothetical protein ABW224_15990 [Kibdelosporangium sp.]
MPGRLLLCGVALIVVLAGCGSPTAGTAIALPPPPVPLTSLTTSTSSVPPTTSATPVSSSAAVPPPPSSPPPIPAAGNPAGRAVVPADGKVEDTSKPTRVIGDGTPASCTSQAVVSAVAAGGVITFSCGPAPVTIQMTATAKIKNATGPKIVLDGGGRVTLSGGGQRRILYMNTCDKAQGHTTSHCQDQDHPLLTLQNLTFADGNSTGDATEGGGGGAVFVRGGRVKVVNSRFTNNRCDPNGPDLGGAGLRVMSQSKGLPVYVVSSTFEGGQCANGGALSGLHVSFSVLNSVLRNNSAIGRGANPARGGTPGGGSGGAIYNDGDKFTVRIAGTLVENNKANEGGGAVFFVSNNRTGTLAIEGSTLRRNPSAGFETTGYRGIFFLGAGNPSVTSSTIQ